VNFHFVCTTKKIEAHVCVTSAWPDVSDQIILERGECSAKLVHFTKRNIFGGGLN